MKFFLRQSFAFSLAVMMSFSALGPVFAQEQEMAFNSQLSPGSKVFEANRGDVINMEIYYTNMIPATANIAITVEDFFYGAGGVEQFVPASDAVIGKSLSQWVTVPDGLTAPQNEKVKTSLEISIPEDANYGDHHAVVYFSNAVPEDSEAALVGVQGRLASLLTVKVLGGEPVISGSVKNFDVETREKARNTATFEFFFANTGSEFFDIETIIEIYEEEAPAENVEPIKVIKKQDSVFPNIGKSVKVSLGDLGDDFGEDTYYAHVLIQEKAAPSVRKRFFTRVVPFDYYVPLQVNAAVVGNLAAPIVQKEMVEVSPPIVEIVKELGLYIGAFLIVFMVLIRFLFFPNGLSGKKKKSKG